MLEVGFLGQVDGSKFAVANDLEPEVFGWIFVPFYIIDFAQVFTGGIE